MKVHSQERAEKGMERQEIGPRSASTRDILLPSLFLVSISFTFSFYTWLHFAAVSIFKALLNVLM
jgi:hypothetical protein